MELRIFKSHVLRFSSDDMMSIKRVSNILFLAVTTILLKPSVGLALTVPEAPPSAWNRGSFGVQTSSEYFFSNKNYEDTRGSFDVLPTNNKWTSFENRFRARYGFSESLSLFTGFGANAATATNNGFERTNSAATEVFAGVDFLLARRWWRVVPEFEASYAFDTPVRGQTSPMTNNGASYANAGVFFFKPYRYLRFEGYLGFHFPSEDLAKLFRYSLGTEIAMFGAFTLGASIQGYETVIGDNTSLASRRVTQITADASSGRFQAYNPALLEARGWLGLRFDRAFGMRLGYAKTLNGVRVAEGQSLLLSLYYNSAGTKTRVSSRRVEVGPAPVAKRAGEFRTEPEPQDPEIFEQNDETLDNTERLFDRK